MTAGRRGRRKWGAVAAAYLFVLQATLTGLALGAHAAPAVAPFGDAICSSAGNGAPERDGGQGAPDCLHLGCVMAGAASAPAPETTSIDRPRAATFAGPSGRAPDAVARAPERSPRTTRAPPPTA